MPITTAKDFESDVKAFTSLLDDAEGAASNATEITFVSEIVERYENFGLKMFLTQKQYDWLIKIADW